MPATATLPLSTLDGVDVAGKVVLVRVDLNVPMSKGRVADMSRIRAILPTLHELTEKHAKVVVLSHFDRPKGKFMPSMSLAPLIDVVDAALNSFTRSDGAQPHAERSAGRSRGLDEEQERGQESIPHRDGQQTGAGGKINVKFGVDCVGQAARQAVDELQPGEVLVLENLRFHAGEEKNDPEFAAQLASLGEIYVNDAFSVAHRSHASITGIANRLPAFAGRLLQREVEAFEQLLEHPKRPLAAVVGGAKISTKLEILGHLLCKVDYLVVGGAMANTFLKAQGHEIGTSLHEPELLDTARDILKRAKEEGCELLLPMDVVVTQAFEASAPAQIVPVGGIPADCMQLDVGPETVLQLLALLKQCRSIVWNGPLGAFETRPFDVATTQLARMVAGRSRAGELFSMAGGGDTVSALSHAGLADEFSYLSTAGGAFLEWLQGKTLPGIDALQKAA